MTGVQLRWLRAKGGTEVQRRSFNWVVALVGIGGGGRRRGERRDGGCRPQRGERVRITVQGRDTMQWEGNLITGSDLQWTFRSRAPFCTTGTFVEFGGPGGTTWRFTCDDGTGSLTVSIARAWDHNPQAQVWNTTWRILDGSGNYAGLTERDQCG
jgi:hypothetical protein